MKTPRLALFAFLALALAPLANAALPTWPVADESFRAWPKVFFTAGGAAHTLNCRWAECNPEKNKSVSNLYVMKESGVETIKVTIMDRVPLGRWDPRRRFGSAENRQGYTRVPKVIEAARKKYVTELSNFKLDNTGKELVVVQGNKKFPATTDIRWQYVEATGNVIAVAPPTKTADDVFKPGTGGRGDNDGRGGRGAPASGKWWCDPKTGEKYSAARGRKGSTLLASKDAVCKKTGSGAAPVVTQPPVAGALLLSARERIWLDRRQAHDYEAEKTAAEAKPAAEKAAAIKAVAEKYRKLVVENLAPNTAASTAYAAAAADPKAAAETIDKTLPAEVWGGKNDAIVENFGPRAEIQLSKEDWEVLNSTDAAGKQKYADALAAYTRDRTPANGKVGQAPEYRKDFYDPIVLHRLAEAARKAIGATVVAPPKPGGDPTALEPRLTPEELALLTPEELTKYLLQLKAANATPPNQSAIEGLSNLSKQYRAAITAEGRKPYATPKTLEEFVAMKPWQKAQFCAPSVGAADATKAPPTADDAHGELALPDLIARAERLSGQGGAGRSSSAPAWAADACKKFTEEQAYTTPNNGGTGRGNQTAVVPGPDAEKKEKEKSKWLTQDLLTSAAKGALVGLLVGSLFGPAGLILGPLIGGALFYGLTKITG